MKFLIIFLWVLATGHISFGQNGLVPASYKLMQEIQGDLNKDSIDEKVVVYEMTDSIDKESEGSLREIIIYKKEKQDWVIWHRSKSAIGNSKSGGMMGDPFTNIEIIKGILIINHEGGSSWKWHNTDKYRFQHNAFELIGHSTVYGKLCEYWLDMDYNISTGKVIVTKEYENCDNQQQVIYKKENEKFTYKLKATLTLKNRKQVEMKIISPKYKHEIYF